MLGLGNLPDVEGERSTFDQGTSRDRRAVAAPCPSIFLPSFPVLPAFRLYLNSGVGPGRFDETRRVAAYD
jgi:hypothetical protein